MTLTLDEVTADLGPNSADGEDSQDATAVKSSKNKDEGHEIRRFIQSYKLGLYLYGKGSYTTESFGNDEH